MLKKNLKQNQKNQCVWEINIPEARCNLVCVENAVKLWSANQFWFVDWIWNT